MKKYILPLIIGAALMESGCQKDFLDKEPLGKQLASNYYQNEASAIAVVNAAYDPLQWQNTGLYHPEFFFGDITSDDALKGGSDLGDLAEVEDLVEFKGKASNPHLIGLWSTLFQGVYRANQVIVNVPGMTTVDTKVKNKLVGEAKFLRAYYYFYLVRIWGDVPLITKILAPSEYKQPRVKKELVFAQIEQDLKDAAASLPEKSEYPAVDKGRATKGAANAYLLKAYIFQSKWADAEPIGLAIINSKQYSLDSTFSHIFSKAGENGPESIFEVQHTSQTVTGWANANEGNLANVFQGGRDNGYGWGFNIPTKNLADEFETGDPRLKGTIIMNGDSVGKEKANTAQSPTKMLSKKYALTKEDKEAMTAGGDGQSNGPSNQRKMRYADVILMYAEACYHNGKEAEALKALNDLRTVRREKKAGILPDRISTGPQLLSDIYHERRVELAMEGIRFFDIVRQGRAAQIFNDPKVKADKPLSIFSVGVNEVFPVPQGDIDMSGGLMNQNNGY